MAVGVQQAKARAPFRHAHAAGNGWGLLAKRCIDQLGGALEASLGMVYVTEELARDLGSVVTFLRETTGIEHWIGAAGSGICATGVETMGAPGIAVMACDFPAESIRILPNITADPDAALAGLAKWRQAMRPGFAIVHADPRNPHLAELVPGVARATGCFLAGGLTAGSAEDQVADRVTGGGVGGLMFAGDVPVTTGLTQGCTPIGVAHQVTEADGGEVVSLNGRPALEVFKEDIGELLARDLARVGGYIHAALPVSGSDTGDYLVRNLVGIDPDAGSLSIAAQLAAGDRIMFVRRDAAAAAKDLKRMLKEVSGRATGPVRGAVYFSCVARGANLFGPEAAELEIVRSVLGDVPLVGFFGNGEISNDRLYTYTGVLTLFC